MKRKITIFLGFFVSLSMIVPVFQKKVDASIQIINSEETLNFQKIDGSWSLGPGASPTTSRVGYEWNGGYGIYHEPLVYFSLEEIDRSKDIQLVAFQYSATDSPLDNAPYLDIWGVNNYSLDNMFVRNKGPKLMNKVPITSAPFGQSLGVTSYVISQLNNNNVAFILGGATESPDPSSPEKNRNFVVYNSNDTYNTPMLLVSYKDSDPPQGNIIIEGNGFTKTEEVKLQIDARPNRGRPVEMRLGNSSNDWIEPWRPYQASMDWALNPGDGRKTVYLQLRNQSGALTNQYTANVILDTVKPTGSVAINEGEVSTKEPKVTLQLDGQDTNGVTEMQISNKREEWPNEWVPFSETYDWTLASPTVEERKTVYVRFKDRAGNSSDTIPASIDLELSPLIDGVKNEGIYNQDVRITLAPRVKTVYMNGKKIFARENGDTTAKQIAITETGEIELEVTNTRGELTELQFLIDREAPTGTIIINGTEDYTNTRQVILDITANDVGGAGHVQMRFRNAQGTWQDNWENIASSKPWTLEEAGDSKKTVYMQLRDRAQNVSTHEATIIYKSLPVSKDHRITGWIDQSVRFKKGDFMYDNEDNREIEAVRIETLPDNGQLTLRGKKITSGQIIPLDQLNDVKFTPSSSWSGITSFTWKATNGYEFSKKAGEMNLEIDMDPEKPIIKVNPSSEWTNKTVEMRIVDGKTGPSGLDKSVYKIGKDGAWQTYEKPVRFTTSGEYEIYARTKDHKGKYSELTQTEIKIDRTKPTAPNITLSENDWTNKEVEVSITSGEPGPSDERETEYKIGENGQWTRYKTPFTIKEAGEHDIYARTLDRAGNVGIVSKDTVRINRTAPTMSLVGNEKIVIEVGLSYQEQGVTAYHPRFGDLTDEVQIVGDEFDTNTAGIHKITYRIEDPAGNEVKLHRTIEVVEVTGLIADKVIPGEVEVGDDYQLNVVPVYEKNASQPTYRHNVSFTSNNTKLASVGDDGLITFHKYGKVVITATYGDVEESWVFEIDDPYLYAKEERVLKPGKSYTLMGTNVQLATPKNLQAGTKISIQDADIGKTNFKGLKPAGDSYSFTLATSQPSHPIDPYTLTMGYDPNVESEQVAIYYLDEQAGKWVYIGGEIDRKKHVITAKVAHFSTYAVFADDQKPNIIDFKAKMGENAIKFNFKAEDASGVSYYRLIRNGKEIAMLGGADEQYIDKSVKQNTLYTYELITGDIFGNESAKTIQVKTKHTVQAEEILPNIEQLEDTSQGKFSTKPVAITKKESEKEPVPKTLPNTATPIFSYLFIGLLILSIGICIFTWWWLKEERYNRK